MSSLTWTHLNPTKISSNTRRKTTKTILTRLDNSQPQQQQQQQLNLSVLRFTLGVPGLDESYLPRWIGYGFGSLLVLNHFLGSNYAHITAPQFRSEALGLALAAFSTAVPYMGKFLKGSSLFDQASVPEDTEQIFSMSENVSDTQKENLAWATYVLLRNTNATAVLISTQGGLCVRGYWNIPENVPKAQILDWFERQTGKFGLSDIMDTLYFSQNPDSGLQGLLPRGTGSLVVQPVLCSSTSESGRNAGYVMLVSSMEYAFTDKDRAWIRAVSVKFSDKSYCVDP